MSTNFTHVAKAVNHITDMLSAIGINEYRFCVENDCYVCDKFGHFFSVCKRQYSKMGNLIEKYEVTPTFEGREDVVTDIIKINILDEIIVIPPKTGETMPIIPIIIVLAIGATGIVLFTRKKKDTKKSE